MTIYKTYKGARLDLQHYKGKLTQEFIINVFNEDGTDFDLTVYSNVIYKIFHKQHGTLVLTFDEDDGSLTRYSPADNDIYFYLSGVILTKRPKEYYHECYGVLDNQEQELIFHGIADLL